MVCVQMSSGGVGGPLHLALAGIECTALLWHERERERQHFAGRGLARRGHTPNTRLGHNVKT